MILEDEKNEWNMLSMDMILKAGNARESIMQALVKAEDKYFEEAEVFLQIAKKNIDEAHIQQTEVVQKEARGEEYYYSILFTHAQDTLMTIKSEYNIALHLLAILKKL